MFSFIYAQAAGAGGAAGGGSPLGMLIPFVLIGAVFYFTMLGPQRKREKEREQMLASLAKGDSVVTIGGICGTVLSVTDQHVIVEVDKNTNLKFVRKAIGEVVKPTAA